MMTLVLLGCVTILRALSAVKMRINSSLSSTASTISIVIHARGRDLDMFMLASGILKSAPAADKENKIFLHHV